MTSKSTPSSATAADATSPATSTTIDHRRTTRRAHVIWATLVISLVAFTLAMAATTEQPEGVCTGIGWGCELSGTALAGFLAVILVPIGVVVLLVGHLIIHLVVPRVVRVIARRTLRRREARRDTATR